MRAPAAALALALASGPAGAECRQALAVGLDVSASVDDREYRLQVEGLANALDLTGDGKSNEGPRPREVTAGTATVNALVIGIDAARAPDYTKNDLGELTADFRAEGIRGPDAFVATGLGLADFEAAMIRKRLRELRTVAVGRLLLHDPRGRGGQPSAAAYLLFP